MSVNGQVRSVRKGEEDYGKEQRSNGC